MVKINLIGFKQLQQTVAKLPVELQKEVGSAVQFAAEDFRDRAIVDAPADVGFLRSQITKRSDSELSAEVVSGSKYSAYMEFGTKSKFRPIAGIDSSEFRGKGQGDYFDFLNNILNWVKRKGIAARFSIKTHKRLKENKQDINNLLDVAQAIADSIIRHGVKPHPFFFKQLAPVRRDLIRRIRTILNSITK